MGNKSAEIRLSDSALGNEIDKAISFVRSSIGYQIELFDVAGEFLSEVSLPDDNSVVVNLDLSVISSVDQELKEIFHSYYPYLITKFVPSYVQVIHSILENIAQGTIEGEKIETAIDRIAVDDPNRNATSLISFVEFLIIHEYQLLSLEWAEDFVKLKAYTKRNIYLNLFTLDEHYGPLTREELRILTDASQNVQIPLDRRVILGLLLSFGLRPMQMSLLKHRDIVFDERMNVHYIKVPRVKQRNSGRRHEFTYRPLEEPLWRLIEELKVMNKKLCSSLDFEDFPLFLRLCSNSRSERKEFFLDSKFEYQFHIAPSLIALRITSVCKFLPLSPRTGEPFHLTAYRFRYTIGTNAVLAGMTEEEVAELLDHSNTLSVKHYFRFTQEMWEMLEQATQRRTEQCHFTAAWRKDGDLTENIYGKEVVELNEFKVIGKCFKELACYLEPAVACYSCDKFCPNKDVAAHKNALKSLKVRKQHLKETVPSSTASQFDEALAGCEAAVAYSSGLDVKSIYEGEPI